MYPELFPPTPTLSTSQAVSSPQALDPAPLKHYTEPGDDAPKTPSLYFARPLFKPHLKHSQALFFSGNSLIVPNINDPAVSISRNSQTATELDTAKAELNDATDEFHSNRGLIEDILNLVFISNSMTLAEYATNLENNNEAMELFKNLSKILTLIQLRALVNPSDLSAMKSTKDRLSAKFRVNQTRLH